MRHFSMDLNAPLSAFKNFNSMQHVTVADVGVSLRKGAMNVNLPSRSFSLDRILPYSLYAGGAIALALTGWDTPRMQKYRGWMSATFFIYTHEKIAYLGKGVSKCMSVKQSFFSVT